MNYQASSSAWSQKTVTINSNSQQVVSPVEETVFVSKSGWDPATFAYLNVSQFQLVQEGEVILSLSSCYVVKMDIMISEVLGPTMVFGTK